MPVAARPQQHLDIISGRIFRSAARITLPEMIADTAPLPKHARRFKAKHALTRHGAGHVFRRIGSEPSRCPLP
jgi:hypothetical protein